MKAGDLIEIKDSGHWLNKRLALLIDEELPGYWKIKVFGESLTMESPVIVLDCERFEVISKVNNV
tara:strand:+ start:223 stop:417 length:195 start_codon:yes stop_codon:yes gene_type:complete